MVNANSRRSRPANSGIDDSTALRDVVAMMSADPALKPTTAIKRAGITDPSRVRRLRDKLRKTAKPSEPHRQSTTLPNAQAKPARAEAARTAALRVEVPMEATMASACVLPAAEPANEAHEANRRDIIGEMAPAPLLQRAVADTQAMVFAQIRLCRHIYIHTPLSMFLKNQSVTLETALALMQAHHRGWSELMRSFGWQSWRNH
jgi:hypothetical protein